MGGWVRPQGAPSGYAVDDFFALMCQHRHQRLSGQSKTTARMKHPSVGFAALRPQPPCAVSNPKQKRCLKMGPPKTVKMYTRTPNTKKQTDSLSAVLESLVSPFQQLHSSHQSVPWLRIQHVECLVSTAGSPQRIRRGCFLRAPVPTPTPAIERTVENNGTNEAPVGGLRYDHSQPATKQRTVATRCAVIPPYLLLRFQFLPLLHLFHGFPSPVVSSLPRGSCPEQVRHEIRGVQRGPLRRTRKWPKRKTVGNRKAPNRIQIFSLEE